MFSHSMRSGGFDEQIVYPSLFETSMVFTIVTGYISKFGITRKATFTTKRKAASGKLGDRLASQETRSHFHLISTSAYFRDATFEMISILEMWLIPY